MSLVDIFWIYFILTSLQPWISQRSLEWKRVKLLDKLERERHRRVIALVHRQETMSLLGFPVLRYINIEHSEEVLRAIKLTDRQVPINLIIHTPGRLVAGSATDRGRAREPPGEGDSVRPPLCNVGRNFAGAGRR